MSMDVDAIQQRTRDFPHVALNHGLGAMAFAGTVVEISTGTGIHGGGQHKPGWEG
jgi:hypothetical protein